MDKDANRYLWFKKLIFFGKWNKNVARQVNPEMVGRLERAGLSFTGKDITGRRMEVGTLNS